MIRDDLIQGTDEWLEYRREKWNASETPNVLGIGFHKPYQFAMAKYHDKEVFKTIAMEIGNEQENWVLANLNAQLGLNLKPAIFECDSDNRISASLDGYDDEKKVFCEIKYSREEYDYVIENGKPTPKYYYQIQHQFYASGLTNPCYFAVGCVKEDYQQYWTYIEVKRDEVAIATILSAWVEFEQKYKDYTPTEELVNLATEAVKISGEIKELEDRLDDIKKQMIGLVGETERNIEALGGGSVTIHSIIRKPTYDYKQYCLDNKFEIEARYQKAGGIKWNARVNQAKI